ncbi:glycoside hydrolase family 88 protein [Mariniflexile sp. AS56]|uniref:glycoside hydrolase family 88 protein n=1 Tax=Mariniflexile sp. AS56 TaxID=3063957 RepID=UPI0026F325D2|nr:glycoside hydrolase family 88 protein [Mariniflexile sp. AS56]MDO7172535.1 glycoside hydrolase family 88 protein [Mariniflexile sp. AS56]
MSYLKGKLRLSMIVLVCVVTYSCKTKPSKEFNLEAVVSKTEKQLSYHYGIVEKYQEDNLLPRSIDEKGLVMVPSDDWTSGFFPGELWMMYDLTDNAIWKERAIKYTEYLESEQFNTGTHDVGFMMYCSYGHGYKTTGSSKYKDILIQTAKSLASRYNPTLKSIRSWDHSTSLYTFPVIIDNMMNMELLLWASQETGDPYYKNIAINHTNTTLKNHFRGDNSSYHVVDYSPEKGEIIKKVTNQGYADESAWSRGQAWGLYGFTVMYRATKDEAYLKQAERIAKFILSHKNLPEDKIPYWDFDAPKLPNEPRDASAAAIIASGLYELAGYSKNSIEYLEVADTMLKSLSTEKYLNKKGTKYGFLLSHSTGNWPRNSEIDEPIVYADYYYLEALNRKKRLNAITY